MTYFLPISNLTGPSPPSSWWRRYSGVDLRRDLSSCFVSVILHSLCLITMAFFLSTGRPQASRNVLTVSYTTADQAIEPSPEITPIKMPLPTATILADAAADDASLSSVKSIPLPLLGRPVKPEELALAGPLPEPGWQELLQANGAASGGGIQGRKKTSRALLVAEFGGTPESESAVEKGLEWLVAHQRKDGGWRFDHREGPCDGRCGNHGSIGTSTGATGLCLLGFLGAGYLPNDPKYGQAVQAGLYYLQSRATKTSRGIDLQEGTMYGQAIATIALCEAYAMTGDESLKPIAQGAVDFICYAQHPKGGWRYYPGQPGDTTVFGWQFMALKSAQMAKLHVPSPVIELAKSYLDSVQTEQGSAYGYLAAGKEPTPTAVGLLSRMYTAWRQDDDRLKRGASYLAKLGPSKNDLYFNYYATQVLHHSRDAAWDTWNRKLRDHLIATQSRNGHEAGSWYFPDKHGTAAGRLYSTAIAVMILEVYYRHMPLYGDRSLESF